MTEKANPKSHKALELNQVTDTNIKSSEEEDKRGFLDATSQL